MSTSERGPRPATPPAGAEQLSVWDQVRASIGRLAQRGEQTIAPDSLARKLEARAKTLRGRAHAEQAAETPWAFLAFNKGAERYGVPLDQVLEVQALEQFSPVPGTPAFLPGVVHWRGSILTLLDLGKLLQVRESGLADLLVCVIVEAAGRRLAVVAREVEDIVSIPRSQVRPAPRLSEHVPPEWILGVHDQNRLLVNMQELLRDSRLTEWKQK
jgi:purine-binding chemotaxis protein CheW